MAEQYEYLVIDLTGLDQGNRQSALNVAGLEGWELVSVASDWAYLKRPIAVVLDEKGFFVKDEAGRPIPPPPAPPRKRKP